MLGGQPEPGRNPARSLESLVARGATGSAAAQVGAALVALAAQLILARGLGVQSFGYFIVAWTWALLLAVPCRLGFHNSLIRFTASYRAQGEWSPLRGLFRVSVGAVLGASLGTGGLMAAGAALFRQRMAGEQLESLLLASLALPALALLGVTQAMLKGFRRPALGQFTQRGLAYCWIALLTGTGWAVTGLGNAPVAMVLCAAAAWIAVGVSGFWVLRAADPSVFRAAPSYRTGFWIRSSLPLLLMASMSIIMGQTDTVMLGAMVGSREGGIYAVANRLAQFASLALMASQAIMAPLVAEYHARNDLGALRRLLAMVAWGVAGITALGFVAFAFAGPVLLGFFGQSFGEGFPTMMILVTGQLLNAACGPVGVVLTMSGHQGAAAAVLTGAAFLNVTLNAVLIPLFGMEGAAAASTITIGCWNLMLVAIAFRRLGVNTSVFQRPLGPNPSPGQSDDPAGRI